MSRRRVSMGMRSLKKPVQTKTRSHRSTPKTALVTRFAQARKSLRIPPRSRSWKSGFLTKRSASVELVDSANTLKLSNYVGQRVAATGMLANREMQMLSLRRLAASCT
jgi:hypothetical protein